MADSCATCKYFLATNPDVSVGNCRLVPPRVVVIPQPQTHSWPQPNPLSTQWPIVLGSDWCGNFVVAS